MESNSANEITPEEIAYLAYMAWEKDGCPHGRATEYWLDTEIQLKATRDLLSRECGIAPQKRRAARKVRQIKEHSLP